jgi:hypothetical protein
MVIYKNPIIKSSSFNAFNLDDSDFYILSEFAKKGETFRTRINIASLEERQISRRCDVLYESGFLLLVKSKTYRNQPKKKTRVFGLSLKGFLASLRYCDIEDNYLLKKYLKNIKNNKLANCQKNYIKSHIAYFLKYHQLIGISLKHMRNIIGYMKDFHASYDLLDKNIGILIKLNDEQQNAQYDVDFNLSIPTPELTKIIEFSKEAQEKGYPKIAMSGTEKRDQDMYKYCKYWPFVMNCISKNYSLVKIINEIDNLDHRYHL